jgi:hypothetical protein
MKKTLLLFLLISSSACSSLYTQENVFTAGFRYRPIFPSAVFKTGAQTFFQNSICFSVAQKSGYNAGMIIRRGITRQFSFETGIGYTKRNFLLSITDAAFSGKSDFTIIAYEIPAEALIFLRITDKLFMNTSLGLSTDIYPTDISTQGTYFRHSSRCHSTFQFAALASLGFEYRTSKIGYFYFGSSYHQPFSYFYSSAILYLPKQELAKIKLAGNFIAIDFRYYFHEEALKIKKIN